MQAVKLIFLIVILSLTQAVGSASPAVSFNVKDMALVDAIRYLASFSGKNVVIAPEVTGRVSLQLQDAPADDIFSAFLQMHQLAKWQIGRTWYIAPQKLFIKQQEETAKWRAASEASQPLVEAVWKMRYASADDLAKIIQTSQASYLSKRGHVHVDARTNALCLQDTWQRIQKIRRLVRRLDVPVKQIMIDARLASVDKDIEKELGLTFALQAANQVLESSDNVLKNAYSVAVAKLANQNLLDVKLAALEQRGKAELISRPKLFTANQQSASIEAGEEVPYQEVSEGGGTATSFKKAVLGLKVTPQVLPGDKILLHIQLNQDRPSHRLVQGVPTISTRQIVTTVLVNNGETIVLGGIYESARDQGERRIPILSDLPWLGSLFTLKRDTESKRELLVFVTPGVMI